MVQWQTGNASQVNLSELGSNWYPVQISSLDLHALPQHYSHIQCKLVQLVQVYSVPINVLVKCFMSEHGRGSGSAVNHKNCFAYKVLLVHTQCSSDSGDFLYI